MSLVGCSKLARATLGRGLLLACCSVIVCTLWARDASAREGPVTPEARAAARQLAAEGSNAFTAGDFETALGLFNRAAAYVEAPTIALMQARALAELGRLTAAAERYSAAQQLADEGANAQFRNAADVAARELAALYPRIPTLRVKLVGADAQAADVTVDGRPLEPKTEVREAAVDPGQHSVEVKSASGTSSRRTVTLVESAREELVFSLEPPVRVPANAGPAPTPDAPPARAGGSSKLPAWLTLGAGVAFTGVGATVGVIALGHKSRLDSACGDGCPPGYEGRVHTYRVERTWSYVGFGLGAAGTLTGVLLLRRGSNENETALSLSPSGVSVSGHFE